MGEVYYFDFREPRARMALPFRRHHHGDNDDDGLHGLDLLDLKLRQLCAETF
jgi:hypothetical protein